MTNDTPKPASTVVLCNVTTKWPHKILLVKRSNAARFLPGAHVFPGGALEPHDAVFGAWLARDQKNLNRFGQFFLNAPSVIAEHASAAIRETFEESGISILRHQINSDSRACSAKDLHEILGNPNPDLTPSLDNLWPLSWWITPAGETRRFDTWFFLATVSVEPNATVVAGGLDQETEDHVWLTPNEALERYQSNSMFLAPPTRTILERMNATQNLAEFLQYVDRPLIPIRPYFVDEQDQKILLLPGDPLHQDRVRPSMPLHTRYVFP